MAIKAVSKLTNVSGDAFILQPGTPNVAGEFYKDQATGDVSVQFGSIPQGLLVLVLADGRDSRYPGAFEGSDFVSHSFPGHNSLPLATPAERAEQAAAVKAAEEKKAAKEKAAADAKAAAEKAAADAKAAQEKAAADAKAAADKAAADKAAADKAAADKAAADKAAQDAKQPAPAPADSKPAGAK